MSEWVDCRIPPESAEEIIMVDKRGIYYFGHYQPYHGGTDGKIKYKWYSFRDDGYDEDMTGLVTHWMTIEPPK
jgi:hypothetical protein